MGGGVIDPSTLKFGDRIDNKSTVVGTFDSDEYLGKVIFAVLDAQYRVPDIAWAADLYGVDTGLSNYTTGNEALNAKESGTYNTDYIKVNYFTDDKSFAAFEHCWNVKPLNYNGETYECVLPNAYELQQIYDNRTELDALDPTAEANSTKKLSNWGVGSSNANVWSSNEFSSEKAWKLYSNGWYSEDKNGVAGVIPIIEIPLG